MHKVRLSIVGMMIGIGCMVGLTQTTPVEAAANNGTLKVHEQGTPSHTKNHDPKVCKFNIEGFDFDDGQTGYLKFDVQGGDGPTGTPAGPYAFGPTDATGYYATQYFDLDDGHYKATLYGKDANGHINLQDVKAKSKVFKVICGPQANLTHKVVCVLANNVPTLRVTLTNTGNGSGKITVNGEIITVNAGATVSRDFASGTQVTIILNGQTLYDAAVKCSNDETATPKIDFDLVCDLNQRAAVITFSNSGNADGTAVLNGNNVAVLAGVPVTRTIPTGANGVTVTIEIDGKTVFNQLVNCQPGKGGGSMNGGGTTPATTNAKQLPNTAGDTDRAALAVVGGLATVITLAGLAMRSFLARSL